MICCGCCLGGTDLVTACPDSRSFRSCHCLERCCARSGLPWLSRSALRYLHTATMLNFNLLIYPKDLYGRGYSDAPQTTYDTNLYTSQLAHLMQYIRWEKANIVGVSMVRTYTHFWHTTYYHGFRVVPLLRHSLHTFPTLLTKEWHLSHQRDLWRYVFMLFLRLLYDPHATTCTV